MDKLLWCVAISVFFVGDIITTYVGLSQELMYEQNIYALEWYNSHGLFPMLAILSCWKSIFLLFGYGGFSYINGFHKYGIPLSFILMGGFATVWNSYLIFTGIMEL